jgi:hypothetical protein
VSAPGFSQLLFNLVENTFRPSCACHPGQAFPKSSYSIIFGGPPSLTVPFERIPESSGNLSGNPAAAG